jgi:hypothetical protein
MPLFQFHVPEDVDDYEDEVNSLMFDGNGYFSENGESGRRKEAKLATHKVRRQVKTFLKLTRSWLPG